MITLTCVEYMWNNYINSLLKTQNELLMIFMAELMKRRLYASYIWNVNRILKKSVSSAPEVLSGGPYNHAADWWSLGILLFALATGKVRTNAHTCIFAPTHWVFGLLSEKKTRFCVNIDVSFLPSHCELPLPLHVCLSFLCLQSWITVACWGEYAASFMRCQKTSLLLLLSWLQRWDLDLVYLPKCSNCINQKYLSCFSANPKN